jgi:hypothetical protein
MHILSILPGISKTWYLPRVNKPRYPPDGRPQ